MSLEDLRTRSDLLAVTGDDDVFARVDHPHDLQGWAFEDTVAVMRSSTWRPPALFAWGPRVGRLLDAMAAEGITDDLRGLSVPYEDRGELESRFDVGEGGDWVWMWSGRVTGPVRGTERIVEFDDTADADRLTAFAAENPSAEGKPGTGISDLWLGVTDESGGIVAAGARQRLASGAPHLAGILVTAPARGQGLGRAVTAALTDRSVSEAGVCTLGMYRGNDRARAVYTSLGYVVDKAWASRDLRRRARGDASR